MLFDNKMLREGQVVNEGKAEVSDLKNEQKKKEINKEKK